MSVSRRACNWLDLELCRRAITILLHALELRAVDVSTTCWDKGGGSEGSREVESGNVEVFDADC